MGVICGTPGAVNEIQDEKEEQVSENKLKHIMISRVLEKCYDPAKEFRKEKKGDVIRAREPKVP